MPIKDMDSRAVLLKSLENRRSRYRREFNLARADFSEEAVHDLRVATRRLLALLALLQFLAPAPDIKILRRQLKAQLDGLDELRDAQVMLGEVRAHLAELPGLVSFEEDLDARVQKLLGKAKRSLGRLTFSATSNLNARLLGLRESLSSQPDLGDPLAAADSAYAEVLSRYKMVDPNDPVSFHRLRVAFKKFRYTLEVVQPLVPGLEKAALTELSDYQTLLGNVQDAQVFMQALDHFAGDSETLPSEPVGNISNRENEASPVIDSGSTPARMTMTTLVVGDLPLTPDENETRLAIEGSSSAASEPEIPPAAEIETPLTPTVHSHYTQRLNVAVAEALQVLGKVETFWRATPEQPFPWEVQA